MCSCPRLKTSHLWSSLVYDYLYPTGKFLSESFHIISNYLFLVEHGSSINELSLGNCWTIKSMQYIIQWMGNEWIGRKSKQKLLIFKKNAFLSHFLCQIWNLLICLTTFSSYNILLITFVQTYPLMEIVILHFSSSFTPLISKLFELRSLTT